MNKSPSRVHLAHPSRGVLPHPSPSPAGMEISVGLELASPQLLPVTLSTRYPDPDSQQWLSFVSSDSRDGRNDGLEIVPPFQPRVVPDRPQGKAERIFTAMSAQAAHGKENANESPQNDNGSKWWPDALNSHQLGSLGRRSTAAGTLKRKGQFWGADEWDRQSSKRAIPSLLVGSQSADMEEEENRNVWDEAAYPLRQRAETSSKRRWRQANAQPAYTMPSHQQKRSKHLKEMSTNLSFSQHSIFAELPLSTERTTGTSLDGQDGSTAIGTDTESKAAEGLFGTSIVNGGPLGASAGLASGAGATPSSGADAAGSAAGGSGGGAPSLFGGGGGGGLASGAGATPSSGADAAGSAAGGSGGGAPSLFGGGGGGLAFGGGATPSSGADAAGSAAGGSGGLFGASNTNNSAAGFGTGTTPGYGAACGTAGGGFAANEAGGAFGGFGTATSVGGFGSVAPESTEHFGNVASANPAPVFGAANGFGASASGSKFGGGGGFGATASGFGSGAAGSGIGGTASSFGGSGAGIASGGLAASGFGVSSGGGAPSAPRKKKPPRKR